MADPIGSFSGLASGIQWRDMVDQIMKLESARRLSPVQTQLTARQSRLSAWNTYGGLVARLKTAAAALTDGSAFRKLAATSGKTASGATLFTATASTDAQPGKYRVEVLTVARSEKLNGDVETSTSAALGVAGEFYVNGRRVELATTDSLTAIRDKVNAVNSGSDPSGVTATILSTSATSHRLILTADNTGTRGIELVDGSAGALQSLGILTGAQTANVSSTDPGVAQSQRFQSKTTAIATMLGVTSPPATTSIVIDGQKITVDLLSDTMISIMNKVATAGGSASIVEEKVGADTQYRLAVDGAVSADPTASDPAASQRIVELLGFVTNGKAAQITAGQDARLRIDGFSLTRRSNTVSDAISGMTIDVLAADTTARSTTVTGANLAMVTDPGTLSAGNHDVRFTMGTQVTQNATDDSIYMSVAAQPAGLPDGTFAVAVTTAPVRLESTNNPQITDIVAPASVSPGTYAVNITQAATRNSVTGSVVAGPFLGLSGQSITVIENGITKSYVLSTGDDLDSVVDGLNNMFTSNGMAVFAENSGGRLKLSNTEYGDDPKFQVKTSSLSVTNTYGVGSTGGITYDNGLNVAGTIDGRASTGTGQVLKASGGVVDKMEITYTGTATGAVGTVTITDTVGVTGGSIGGQAATWDAATSRLTVNVGGSLAGLSVNYTGPATAGTVGNVTLATTSSPVVTGVTVGGETATWDDATDTISGNAGTSFEGLELRYTGVPAAGSIGSLVVEGELGVDLSVARDTASTVASVQSFAAAFNEIAAFADKQREESAGLHANGTLRAMLGTIKTVLLTDVPGLVGGTSPYVRGGNVGVALTKTGQLEVDAAKLQAALSTNLADVMNLFANSALASDGEVAFRTSTTKTKPGTYAVSISAAATQASHTGTDRGLGFTYTASNGVSDTLTITDAYSGATANYVVTQGRNLDTIVSELNSVFGNASMALTAERTGNSLRIVGTQYGTSNTFTLSGAAATGALGLSAATYAGTNVAGTIGGNAATGIGQVLTASAGFDTEGLAITFTGSAAKANAGTVRYARGLAGEMDKVADEQSRENDGSVAVQTDVLDRSIELLNDRIDSINARLEVRRQALIRQFTRMEEALSRFQSQSGSLIAQLGSLSAGSGS